MVKPLDTKIHLDIETPTVGGLDVGSVNAAREKAKVLGVGDGVTLKIKRGDTVLFKSWAVDIISIDGKNYYFIDQDSKGLCAVLT